MSLCIRPVVETWGESITYLSRDTSICEMLGAIVSYAEEQRSMKDEPLSYETHDYGDQETIWISDGKAFLDYLAKTPWVQIMDSLANDSYTSSDDEEYERQVEDIKDLCKTADSWRKSIDPDDGSLRIYCD